MGWEGISCWGQHIHTTACVYVLLLLLLLRVGLCCVCVCLLRQNEGKLLVRRAQETKRASAMHGLSR